MEKFEKETAVSDFVRNFVDVPKFYGLCKSCPNCGNVWSCPPYSFDPLEIWNKFSKLRIIVYKIEPLPGCEENLALLEKTKHEMLLYTYALEKKNPGSTALSAGKCSLCSECSRPKNEPCRMPDKMRYSIESLGGDVEKALRELFGIEILWEVDGKTPEYYTLCGGLLLKN